MPSSSNKPDVTSSLSKLSLDGDKSKPSSTAASKIVKPKPKKPAVVDSWEDEDLDDDEPAEEEDKTETQDDGSKAPPPTPISPTYNTPNQSFTPYGNSTDSSSSAPGSAGSHRRPEKTDAVARRMIASALGVKVPRLTEEQRAYDKAVREKERKRREEEKAAEKKRHEDVEKAKAAIWDD
ncbi:hypothetical protein CCHL11_04919 [Colletotrichum chlorophyti]|uniref:Ubiquitin-like protein smt3 n=1 Tax=Colletotrichum chlorophyti TaxID=708187 RepID=A0A1Q8S2D6_9PEZI|nr:hypothetical protein CCHL11_04919 [Colletotrichum chlorophyti]